MPIICGNSLVWRARRLAVAVAMAFALAASAGIAHAQEPAAQSAPHDAKSVAEELAPLTSEERGALIGRMTDEQARDLLLYYLSEAAPAAAPQAAPSRVERLRVAGAEMRGNLGRLISAAGDLPGSFTRLFAEKIDLGGAGTGFLLVVLVVAAFCAVGALAEFLFRRVTAGLLARNAAADASTIGRRLTRDLGQLAHDLGAVAAFAAGYAAAFFSVWEGNAERRDLMAAVLTAILITRGAVALTRFLFTPGRPDWRIMPVDDDAAAHFVTGIRRLAVLGSVLLLVSVLGRIWGIDRDVGHLAALISGIVFVIAALVFLWGYQGHARRAVAAALGEGTVPRWAGGAAGWIWHILAVGYVLVSLLLGIAALLLDQPFDPVTAVLGFVVLFIGYPYLDALVGGLVAPEPAPGAVAPPPAPAALDQTLIDDLGASDDEGAMNEAIAAAARRAVADRLALGADRRVLRRIASIATFVVTMGLFALVTGIDVFSTASEYPIAAATMRVVINVGLVALVAYAVWSFTAAWIDRKLAEEHSRVPLSSGDATEGPSMQGGTRLQTTLPLVRKTIAVTIGLLALLICLDALGVNIVPLIAGAGVVGLAIGFGSQTLVKDVMSGLFFLMDDAFRIGEYVEFGDTGGTVEKFNVRSIVLRGYLGAVYTVPYGSIGKVTNYSRDWVIMKLSFRIPYETDIDKVRKIFKKIGEEMMADPDLAPNFLQPFKSQGVVKMDDSAFIVRGKFMTKPNKQFAVRKEVYERVQRAFREQGIHFAPKRVIVEVPDAADFAEDADEARQAQARTVRAVPAAAAAVAAEGGGG